VKIIAAGGMFEGIIREMLSADDSGALLNVQEN
jgi:hypothetical protein